MKKVKAVQPYIYQNQLNFKNKPFEAWRSLKGGFLKGWYPRFLHSLMFKLDLPTLWHGEARLCFVQPVSLYFDTFFIALTHEIIPFIWDCWPCYYDKMEKWLKRHKVRTAIFTSKQEMVEMQKRCPDVRMMWCPEAVDTRLYKEGKELKDRDIDLLEFGRSNERILSFTNTELTNPEGLDVVKDTKFKHICTKVGDKFIYTDEQLYEAMGDAKVTICLPRSITHPEIADGVETLTQRYWEAMLSRTVIVGHCPKELEEVVGYNPVVELHSLEDNENDNENYNKKVRDNTKQIFGILEHIEEYQDLVDKNRETALRMGNWRIRLKDAEVKLASLGYKV